MPRFQELCPDHSWLLEPTAASQQLLSRNPLVTRAWAGAQLDTRSKEEVIAEVQAKEAQAAATLADRVANTEKAKLLKEQAGAFQLCPVAGEPDAWSTTGSNLKEECKGLYSLPQARLKLHGSSKTDADSGGFIEPLKRARHSHPAIRIRATPGFNFGAVGEGSGAQLDAAPAKKSAINQLMAMDPPRAARATNSVHLNLHGTLYVHSTL